MVAGLRRRAEADDLEQAVYGLDGLDELRLHPLIQQALREAGYGVCPEIRYPSDWVKTRRSEGKRCDVVLTPDATLQALREPHLKGTLFDLPSLCDPETAYWLEIKTVAQFQSEGSFRRYAAELLSPVTEDVKKLWADGLIFHSGLLLVLFTLDGAVAEHDVAAWHRRCLDRGYPVGAPCLRGFKITDRIGNGWCQAALFPVRG